METLALRKYVLNEAYMDVQKLIIKLTRQIQYIYGGEFDELLAEANLLFILAIDDWDKTKSELSTWLTIRIRGGLKDFMRQEYKHTHASIEDENINQQSIQPSQSTLIELFDEIEHDAIIVLQLFLDTPKDVLDDALTSGTNARHIKVSLKKHLRNMGWTSRKVREAFAEIRAAIY